MKATHTLVLLPFLALAACASPAADGGAASVAAQSGPAGAHLMATKLISNNGSTCAVTPDGDVRCWGSNTFGESGYQRQTGGSGRYGSIPVATMPGKIVAAAGGDNTSCAVIYGSGPFDTALAPPGAFTPPPFQELSANVGLYCWGLDNVPLDNVAVAGATLPDGEAQRVSLDGLFRTSTDASGHAMIVPAVDAIGMGENGDLCISKLDGVTCMLGITKTKITGIDETITHMGIGTTHKCMASDKTVWCWGANEHGQVGSGTTDKVDAPTKVAGIDGDIVDLAATSYSTCAATTKGVYCWGNGSLGELGDDTTTFAQTTPVKAKVLDGKVDRIVGGFGHFCASQNGQAYCWGYDGLGGQTAIGQGAGNPQHVPLTVAGLQGKVLDLSAGIQHSCAATTEGVQCWGYNASGELGGAGGLDTEKLATPTFVLATPNVPAL
jgi:alpha-tubulin suppressor-like RCC1 family protein